MSFWAVVFLGVIAVCSLVQAGFLIGLAREGRRLSGRIDDLQNRIDRDLRPSLENIYRMSRNFAEISDLAVLQARRIDEVMADTIDKVEETTTLIRKFVLRPLGPVGSVVAFLRGVRRGLEVYRQLGGFESERTGARRYTDAEDEHLFI